MSASIHYWKNRLSSLSDFEVIEFIMREYQKKMPAKRQHQLDNRIERILNIIKKERLKEVKHLREARLRGRYNV